MTLFDHATDKEWKRLERRAEILPRANGSRAKRELYKFVHDLLREHVSLDQPKKQAPLFREAA